MSLASEYNELKGRTLRHTSHYDFVKDLVNTKFRWFSVDIQGSVYYAELLEDGITWKLVNLNQSKRVMQVKEAVSQVGVIYGTPIEESEFNDVWNSATAKLCNSANIL